MLLAPKNPHYDVLMTSPHAVGLLNFMLKGANQDIASQLQSISPVISGLIAESAARKVDEMRNVDHDIHQADKAPTNGVRAAVDSLRALNEASGATSRDDIEKIIVEQMHTNNIVSDGDKQAYLSALMGGQAVQYARGQEASIPESDLVLAGQQMASVAEIAFEHKEGVVPTPDQVSNTVKSAFKSSGVSISMSNLGKSNRFGEDLMASWNNDPNAGIDHTAMDNMQGGVVQMQKNDLDMAMDNAQKTLNTLNEFVSSEDKNVLFADHIKKGDPKSFFDTIMNAGNDDMPTTRVGSILSGMEALTNSLAITRGGIIDASNMDAAQTLLNNMSAIHACSAPFMQDDSHESVQMIAHMKALQNTMEHPDADAAAIISAAMAGFALHGDDGLNHTAGDQGLGDEQGTQNTQGQDVIGDEEDAGAGAAPTPTSTSGFSRPEDAFGRRGWQYTEKNGKYIRIAKKPPQFASDKERLEAMNQWASESKQNIQAVTAGLPKFCSDFLFNLENFLQATLGGGISDQKYGKKINDAMAAKAASTNPDKNKNDDGSSGDAKKQGREQTHIIDQEAIATPMMK